MAIGDDALAAGFATVPNTGDDGKVRFGAREINKTRDYIAQAVRALAIRKFNSTDEMYSTSGSFTWQEALVAGSKNRYRWTGNIWQLFYGEGTWYPNPVGDSPFTIGTDPIREGDWMVRGNRFWVSGRIVFGGGVNLGSTGHNVIIQGVPSDIQMTYRGSLGSGLYVPVERSLIPVVTLPSSPQEIAVRTVRYDGILIADKSLADIAQARQSDYLTFNITGTRSNG